MYKVSCGAQGCNPSWPLEPGAPGMSHMHAVCILLCGWIAIVPWLAVWLCCDCCGFMACRVAPRPPEVEPLCTVAEASWGHLPGGAGAALKGLTGEGGMGRVGPQENAGVGHMVLASWWRVTEMLPASTEPDGGRRGKKKKKNGIGQCLQPWRKFHQIPTPPALTPKLFREPPAAYDPGTPHILLSLCWYAE